MNRFDDEDKIISQFQRVNDNEVMFATQSETIEEKPTSMSHWEMALESVIAIFAPMMKLLMNGLNPLLNMK